MSGIRNSIVYWLAVEIFDLTIIFLERYVSRPSRQWEQMEQAARSGKQDLVEGSYEISTEGNLKLSGVSRASYAELVEDYSDFLWKKGLPVWDKNDPRVLKWRRELVNVHEIHVSHGSNESHGVRFGDAESFANLLITLCWKELFLMDRFLSGNEKRFVKEGGFRESLFKKRLEWKKNQK